MGVTEILKDIEVKAQEGQLGIAAELQAEYQRGWDEAGPVFFKKGQDSIILPDPSNTNLVYSQEDFERFKAQIRGEKDAEYGPQLAAKDQELANGAAELAAVKLDLETLKSDFDSKVVNGAMERVDKIKTLAKDAVIKMAVADQPIADATVAELDNA